MSYYVTFVTSIIVSPLPNVKVELNFVRGNIRFILSSSVSFLCFQKRKEKRATDRVQPDMREKMRKSLKIVEKKL